MDSLHLTRPELHAAVWTRPIGDLARDWGVAPSQIAQACTRMRVRLPGSDHWDRVRAGVHAARAPLDPAPDVPTSIELTRKGKRAKGSIAAAPTSASTESPEDAAGHALVVTTRQALDASTTIELGLVRVPASRRALDVRVSRDGVPRALALLAGMLEALQKAGASVDVAKTPTGTGHESWVVLDGERIQFNVEEAVRREDPPPERTGGLGPRKFLIRGGRGTKPTWPDSTFHPTGKLTLRIHGLQGTGARQNLVDRPPTGPLESRLDEIVSAFQEAAAAVKKRRDEEARRKREHDERRRQEADMERRRRENDERVQQMFQMKRHWTAAEELRSFVRAAEAAVPEPDRTEQMQEWLDWASSYADAVDPLHTPDKAERLLLKYDMRSWYSEAVLGAGRKTTIW